MEDRSGPHRWFVQSSLASGSLLNLFLADPKHLVNDFDPLQVDCVASFLLLLQPVVPLINNVVSLTAVAWSRAAHNLLLSHD